MKSSGPDSTAPAPAEGGEHRERSLSEERRAHPRYALQIEIDVCFRDPEGGAFVAHGVTVNISRGGLFATVDRELPLGEKSDCLVQFKAGSGVIRPEARWGRALRSSRAADGFEVAIAFYRPVDVTAPEES